MNDETISADELINQITDTLCEVDVEFLCYIANKVLSADHKQAGEDSCGYGLVYQRWVCID
jgi:hypothetical protein